MPSTKKVTSLDLQARDFLFLRGLFESRVMTLLHAATLYFAGHREATKKRVQRLKLAGYVRERPRRSHEPSVLFLTRDGCRLLADQGHLADYPQIGLASLEKRAQVSDLTLRHELEVMDVKAAMVTSVNAMPGFRVTEFSTWPLLFQFVVSRSVGDGYRSTEVTVKPDGFIRIEEQEPDGPSEHTFFLEVDRSTETLETLAQKAFCYLDYYRQGGLAARYGHTAEEYRDFPFRVLMVFRTAERRNNTAERLLLGSPPILSQVWLTTFREVTADPLGLIWVRPMDFRDAVRGTDVDMGHARNRGAYRRQSGRETLLEKNFLKQRLLVTTGERTIGTMDTGTL